MYTHIRALLALAATACITTPGSQVGYATQPGRENATAIAPNAAVTSGISAEELTRVIEHTSVARHLKQVRRIEIVLLPEVAFRNAVRSQYDDHANEEGDGRFEGVAIGLAHVAPTAQPTTEPPQHALGDLMSEEVAAYYDIKLDRVVAPNKNLLSAADRVEEEAVIAHESQHALQAQHFPALRDFKPKTHDGRLAKLALIEGDAMVAMAAYLGEEAGMPIGRTLRRMHELTRHVALTKLNHDRQSQPMRMIDGAPLYVQEELRFPYESGMTFVTDMVRTGGFELVNSVYTAPPVSTAEILHPDKYLKGEVPREIAALALPNAGRLVAEDTLGEFGIRTLLSPCSALAVTAAAGWAGDRYSLLSRPKDGAPRVLDFHWISAWDSESDAQEFAAALESADLCLQDHEGGGASQFGKRLVVVRGKLVTVSRTTGDSQALAFTDTQSRLWATVGRELPALPRSMARVPPREPLPLPASGTLADDVYTNSWLGIVGRTPPGMTAKTAGKSPLVAITRQGSPVQGALFLSERQVNPEQNERTFDDIKRAISQQVPTGANLVLANAQDLTTSLGRGIVRTWNVGAGDNFAIRAVLIPVCAQTGSLIFVHFAGNAQARDALDAWMDSFRFSNRRTSAACAYLDPK